MDTDVITTLNDLIQISKDGEEGFRTAAENVQDSNLKSILLERAESCKKAALELQEHVSRSGIEPEEGGTVLGAIHRGWLNLKSILTGHNDHAILVECERGEEVARDAYSKALDQELPGDIRAIIQNQYEGVIKNHDLVRDLRGKYTVTK